jgi:hypothetical protein
MIYTRRFDEGCQDSFRTVEEGKREDDDEIQFNSIHITYFHHAYLFHCNDFCFSLKGVSVRREREGRGVGEGGKGREQRCKNRVKEGFRKA